MSVFSPESAEALKDEIERRKCADGASGSFRDRLIRNDGGKPAKVHRPLCWSTDVPPTSWQTWCGWKFGCARHSVAT
eukprot:4277021-Karenia_brevis.AAC.1